LTEEHDTRHPHEPTSERLRPRARYFGVFATSCLLVPLLGTAQAWFLWSRYSAMPHDLLLYLLPPYVLLLTALGLISWRLSLADLRRRESERLQVESREVWQELLDGVSDIVFDFAVGEGDFADSRVLRINAAGTRLLGLPAEGLAETTLGKLLVARELKKLEATSRQLLNGKNPEGPLSLAMTVDGTGMLSTQAGVNLVSVDEEAAVLRVIARDVHELMQGRSRLSSVQDALVLQAAVGEALEFEETLEVRLETVLEQFLEHADLRQPGLAAIYRYDKDEERLVLLASRGTDSADLWRDETELPLPSGGLCAGAISSGCLQFAQYCGHAEQALHPNVDPGEHGHCVVPLQAGSKVRGLLFLFTPPNLDWLGERRESLEQLGLRLGGTLMREEIADALGRQAEVLRESLARAEEDVAGKVRFLEDMGAKLRTPVNGITSLMDIALQAERRTEQRERLEAARRASHSLLKIIDNVLDLSRIETGNFDVTEREFDLRDAIRDALNTMAWQAEAKGLALRAEVEKDLPSSYMGDPERLDQVLLNLIGNAVQYTEEGEVVVKVEAAKLEPEAATLHFSVRDTGIGIHEDKQQEIFQAFSQADSGVPHQADGTGLGLTLCAMLVKLMGGRIWVQSAAGQGSTFHFTIALRLSGQEEARRLTPASRDDLDAKGERPKADNALSILLAEDDQEQQRLAESFLIGYGHEVLSVTSGIKAIEAIAQADFDLVLMDIQMPDMDGLTTTRAIREFEKSSGGHIPIIGMTVHATQSDRDRYLTAGMDGCLTKPIQEDELVSFITQVDHKQKAAPPREDSGAVDGKEEAMDLNIFDKTSALDRMGGDMELLIELAGMFLEDCSTMLHEIESALARADSDAVQRSAHTLKGAVGNFSAQSAYNAAYKLETIGHDGDLNEAPAAYSLLKQEISRLKPALSNL